ncbi:protein PML-like [Haliotis rubra]|uniref:protein PML-like n=1 Tax=Haliotis rubra TaxID=36100 RepID=UPI001EE59E3E|nr:protein PML-like [Haliotis rubra]
MEPFPKCVVCSTSFRYRGPQPHLLPCLHPVCENCLKSWELKTLVCSVCLKSHAIHEGQFPVDEVTRADVFNLTSKHRPSEFLCTNEEDGNQAVCWCGECGDFLCEHCQVLHAGIKSTRSHATTLIPDLPEKVKGSQTECDKHGQSLNIFDAHCDSFICSRCFYEDHVGHSTINADMFLSTEEEKLSNCLKSATDKKEEIDLATSDVNEQTRIIQEKAVSLKETVKHTFSELKTLIDQREKEVLVELDQLLDSMRNINDSRYPVLKSSETSCQTVLDYIKKTLLYASPSHLHKLKSSITQACESCVRLDVPFVHKNESSVMFSKQGLQDVKSLISCIGSFFVSVKDKDQVTETSSFCSGRELWLESTIAQLRDQKLKLAKEVSELKNMSQSGVHVVNDLHEEVARLKAFVVQMDPEGGTRGMFLHAVRRLQDVRIVKCPKMMLDAEKASTNWVHINDKGILVNEMKPGHPSYYSKRKSFKNYCGTCSTFPLPSSGLVYWEVEAELDKPVFWSSLVLEVGVCGEEVMDNDYFVGKQTNSCCLLLARNEFDNESVLKIMQNGELVDMRYRHASKGGVVVRVMYGILVNMDRKCVNFIDIFSQEMLACGHLVNLKHNSRVWPVFGVFSGYTKVAIRLVSGGDVQMEGWKKNLICQSQSHL